MFSGNSTTSTTTAATNNLVAPPQSYSTSTSTAWPLAAPVTAVPTVTSTTVATTTTCANYVTEEPDPRDPTHCNATNDSLSPIQYRLMKFADGCHTDWERTCICQPANPTNFSFQVKNNAFWTWVENRPKYKGELNNYHSCRKRPHATCACKWTDAYHAPGKIWRDEYLLEERRLTISKNLWSFSASIYSETVCSMPFVCRRKRSNQ